MAEKMYAVQSDEHGVASVAEVEPLHGDIRCRAAGGAFERFALASLGLSPGASAPAVYLTEEEAAARARAINVGLATALKERAARFDAALGAKAKKR